MRMRAFGRLHPFRGPAWPALALGVVALVIFPLALNFVVLPHFADTVRSGAEVQSTRLANHLADEIHLSEWLRLGKDAPPPGTIFFLRGFMDDLGVNRVNFYSADGRLTLSTSEKPPSAHIEQSVLDAGIRSGKAFSSLVRKEEATAEGERWQGGVVETYVPVMEGDRYLGALEIYLDVSAQMATLNQATRQLTVASLGAGVVLLLTLALLARRAAAGEVAVRESEQRYRNLLEQASDGIFLFTPDGELLEANQAGREMVGVKRGESPDVNPAGIFEVPDCDIPGWCFAELVTGRGVTREGRLLSRQGEPLEVEINFKRLAEDRVQAIVRDITRRKEAEAEVRRQLSFLQTLIDALPQPVFYKDTRGVYQGCNLAFADMLGVTRDEVVGRTARDLSPPETAEAYERQDEELFREFGYRQYELTVEDDQRRERDVLLSKAAYTDAEGRLAGLVGHFLDITDRKDAERALQQAYSLLEDKVEERTRRLREANQELTREIGERRVAQQELQLMGRVFEHSLDGITITDVDGTILQVNPAFTHITGYTEDEVVGKNPRILKSDRHGPEFYKEMWRSLLETGTWEGEIWNRRKSGEAYPEWLSISALKNAEDETTHYVAVFHDITEIKRSEELLKHQAYHDALTGLPNRLLLLDRLDVAIQHARRQDERLALIFMDLDNFKNINDSMGHSFGDLLLMAVAHRLKGVLREQDSVARLGGDEFVVMVEEVRTDNDPMVVGERIMDALHVPFQIKGRDIYVTGSVGVTYYPEDGDTPESLIKNADTAMYRAKEAGRNQIRLFTRAMNERALQRLELERAMRRAIDNEEFEVFYQPKVHAATGGIIGMEALVRWRREDGSLVSPADFIPLAEENGMIASIDAQVLRKALADTRAWHDAGHGHLAVAVNLSARQLQNPALPESLGQAIRESGLDPSLVEFEITETAIMTSVERGVETLRRIRETGAHIAVDDFGTGYSSLYYLKRFPIRGLKIDRSFTRDLTHDPDDAAIVRAIISMARSLGLHVTAEGVETADQMHALRKLDCDFLQGYLLARPMPPEEFATLLEKGGRLAGSLFTPA
ncbi:sensor domain-containing protein [Desulfohalovibrio reitneri]|uniref:sensor domain-containing protein n=1 Tax=Desulfohalovibrio reitneri TaxID=1307759 RepID=UPI00068A6BBE|nr:EAL domain-containing protein [Desulfohalovibrio reitneri]